METPPVTIKLISFSILLAVVVEGGLITPSGGSGLVKVGTQPTVLSSTSGTQVFFNVISIGFILIIRYHYMLPKPGFRMESGIF